MSQPSARELPGTRLRVVNRRTTDGVNGAGPRVSPRAALQHDSGVSAYVRRCSEEACVSGGSAERGGIVVMHFTDQCSPTAEVFIHGRRRRRQPFRVSTAA